MVRTSRCMWLPVLTFVLLSPAVAQQPAVVLSAKSVDTLLSDARKIFSAGGNPHLEPLVDVLIDTFTQGKGLAGIGRDKPLGAYLSFGTGGTDMVVFIPVTDLSAFRDLLKLYYPKQDAAEGMFSIERQGQQIYAKYTGGYCFFTPLPTSLEELPDPATIAGGKYDLAIEADLSRIPEELKDGIAEQLGKRLVQQTNLPSPAEEPTSQLLQTMLKQGERFSAGLEVNQQTSVVGLDVNLVARPGTPLADAMARYGKSSSPFAALAGTGSAASILWTMPVSDFTRQPLQSLIKTGTDRARAAIDRSSTLSDTEKKKADGLVDDVLKVIRATGEQGQVDWAVAVNSTSAGMLRAVSAAKIAQAQELSRALAGLASLGEADPELKRLKLDVAKHGTVPIHSLSLDLDVRAKALLGDGPAHFAVDSDRLIFAVGDDSLAALKSAIDTSGQPGPARPPVWMRIRPSKFLAMPAFGDEQTTELARKAFSGEGDFASFEVLPMERGVRARLELGGGFLRFVSLRVGKQFGGVQ